MMSALTEAQQVDLLKWSLQERASTQGETQSRSWGAQNCPEGRGRKRQGGDDPFPQGEDNMNRLQEVAVTEERHGFRAPC